MAGCRFSLGISALSQLPHLKALSCRALFISCVPPSQALWPSLYHSLCMMSLSLAFPPTLYYKKFQKYRKLQELCNVHSKPTTSILPLTSSRVCFYHTCPPIYCSDSLLGCTLNLSSVCIEPYILNVLG